MEPAREPRSKEQEELVYDSCSNRSVGEDEEDVRELLESLLRKTKEMEERLDWLLKRSASMNDFDDLDPQS